MLNTSVFAKSFIVTWSILKQHHKLHDFVVSLLQGMTRIADKGQKREKDNIPLTFCGYTPKPYKLYRGVVFGTILAQIT